MGLLQLARGVLYGLTKEVLESASEPQLTSDNVGFNPLVEPESQWSRQASRDEFIFQEFSSFPDRDTHGGEPTWRGRARDIDAVHDLSRSTEVLDSVEVDSVQMAWKEQRPPLIQTIKRSFLWGSVLSLLMGTVFGSLCMFYSYASMHTSDNCWWRPWKDIPHDVQWYIEAWVYAKLLLYRFSYFVSVLLIFKPSQIAGIRMKLFIVVFVFALLDIAYKLLILLVSVLRKSTVLWIPGNVLLLIALVAQAYILSGKFRNETRGKLALALQFALPWALGRCAQYALVYGVYPWYKDSNKSTKFLIAAGAPVCVVLLKAISRVCVQRLWGINHPGTSFIFLAPLYCVSALFTRMLQANLANLEQIAALAAIHGLVEVIERSTMALRDHIHNQIFERRLASCGSFRTPRSERLHTDIVILSMLQESISIVAVNGFVLVFRMVYSSHADYSQELKTWLIKTVLQLGIEWFFTCISFAIATHFQNMPIRRVWKSKWHLHLAVNVIMATGIFFPLTGYLYSLMDTTFNDFRKQECSIPF